MKIGILAYRQKPYISANTAISYIIGEELREKYEVVFIGRKQDKSQNENDSYHEIPIRYLNDTPKTCMTRMENILVRQQLIHWAYYKDAYSLKKIVKREQINVLLCITAPNDDVYITMSANLAIPVFLYQLDPFYNLGDNDNQKLKKQFIRYIKKASHVFTTDLLMQSYMKDTAFISYLGKISVVQFPKLVEHKDISKLELPRIRLLYAGSLYAGRKYTYLIDIKKCLPTNCDVVFCGKCDNPQSEVEMEQSGIQCMGYCDQQKLEKEIAKASVLVNIGNTVHNQLPSKIIDYISTGKPIINIQQIENCPTIEVLRKYELALNVFASQTCQKRDEILEFVQKYSLMRIPWETIREMYYEYTPEYVTGQVINAIQTKIK